MSPQNYRTPGNSQEIKDGHSHEDHVGDLGCGTGDTSGAFAPGKY